MAFAEFREGQIHYTAKGDGPAVVFLHGFLENLNIWNDYAQKLSKGHKAICIDLPGHGKSSNFGYCHTMELMADAVMSVLKQESVRRFYLIGHSLGGYVSMAIAEQFPDNLKGICMFHSTADGDSDQRKSDRDRVIEVVKSNKDLFINEAIPNLFNTHYKPYKRGVQQIKKMAKSMSAQSIIAALEGMKIRTNREIVARFAPYPMLYIIGKHDNMIPWEKLLAESELSEEGSAFLLEEGGHMGFMEFPGECFKAIRKWLNQ